MKYRNNPPYRSFAQPFGSQGQSPFPGITDPFFDGGSVTQGPPSPVPFNGPQFQQNPPSIIIQPASELMPASAQTAESGSGKSGFNLASSLADLKGMVDRMGGIDGIITTMQKVQKVVSSVQQMAPLLKVLAKSLGKKGAAAAIAEGDALPRRRRRRRTGGSAPGGQRRRKARARRR